jgi:hypothetical protein
LSEFIADRQELQDKKSNIPAKLIIFRERASRFLRGNAAAISPKLAQAA